MDKPVVTNRELLVAARAGLNASPKRMEPKWFYDRQGSALFEAITRLPEYYPTQTEISILRERVDELAKRIPKGAVIVELGSGASTKTRILLDALPNIHAYCPLDISKAFLLQSVSLLETDYPDLSVRPIADDFMSGIDLPTDLMGRPLFFFFPGSTIGNLDPEDAIALLRRIRSLPAVGGFILGADLVKDVEVLVRAYDDSQGVTAAFNRNLLHRMNREIGATFDTDLFRHEARWNADLARIEMHLISTNAHVVSLSGEDVAFAAGESIHTESSHKYSQPVLAEMADAAGWSVNLYMTDPAAWFSVSLLVPR